MSQHISILANPTAGAGRALRLAAELRTLLERCGHHVTDASRRDVPPCDLVVVIGGDGSLREAVEHLPQGTRLTCLPAGTGNQLASQLGFPRSAAAAVELLETGTTRAIRTIRANDTLALGSVGVGLDAAMVAHLAPQRFRWLPRLGWIASALRVASRLPHPGLQLTTHDGRELEQLDQVLVSRVGRHGGVLPLPDPPTPFDSRLRVYAFGQRSRMGWLRTAWRSARRRLRDGTDVHVLDCDWIDVRGDAPWHADGDVCGTAPLRIGLGRTVPVLLP